jgi:hypothetical protein
MSQSHEIKFSPQELALNKHFNNAGFIYHVTVNGSANQKIAKI